MPRTKRKIAGGAKRMSDLGYKQVQIWLTEKQNTAIATVADILGLTKTGFMVQEVMKAVEHYWASNR